MERRSVPESSLTPEEIQMLRAWDPDYTKVTPDEARRISKAEKSGFVDEDSIDWNNLSNMDFDA